MNKVAPNDHEFSAMDINSPYLIPTYPHPYDTSRICKICLEEETPNPSVFPQEPSCNRSGNQLVVPCECSGSVGYVHEKCIKTWIWKQIQNSRKKQAFCQICKSQIFFKMKKSKYCEVSIANLSLISSRNILSAIIELFLLIVAAVVFRYSLNPSSSNLLKYSLVAMIGIVAFAFCLTFLLMISEAFVKFRKEISQILSVQESEQLGFRDIRIETTNAFNKLNKNIAGGSLNSGNKNKIANNEGRQNPKPINVRFVEINP